MTTFVATDTVTGEILECQDFDTIAAVVAVQMIETGHPWTMTDRED